jgi:hypothetical protein
MAPPGNNFYICCHPAHKVFCHINYEHILIMMKLFDSDDPAENLIIRFLNGQLTEEETDELNLWIEDSRDNQ